jgi:hypothetical protein
VSFYGPQPFVYSSPLQYQIGATPNEIFSLILFLVLVPVTNDKLPQKREYGSPKSACRQGGETP